MTAIHRYGEIADGIKLAAQADAERLKVGRLILDLQKKCGEQLVDLTVTILAAGRVHVQLVGVDWELKVRTRSDDLAEAVDKALDDLNRRGGRS